VHQFGKWNGLYREFRMKMNIEGTEVIPHVIYRFYRFGEVDSEVLFDLKLNMLGATGENH
jgi:hypothetical protein